MAANTDWSVKQDGAPMTADEAAAFNGLSQDEIEFFETHQVTIKQEFGPGQTTEPFFYEGIHLPPTPDHLKPASSDAFVPNPIHDPIQLPPVIPAYRAADWWKDAVTNDDLMLVLVLTLEGFSTINIHRRLKAEVQPGLNELLSDHKIIYDMQRNIGGVFRGRVLPKALKATFAQGLIQGFINWCNNDNIGLIQLSRAREYVAAHGIQENLRVLARVRTSQNINICDQFGYTADWVEQRNKDNVWRNLLFEWWEHGTIDNKAVPEVGF